MLGKMKTRKIDVFFMRKFDEYCNDQLHYTNLADQKDFDTYIATNKKFLVALYVQQRRLERKLINGEIK